MKWISHIVIAGAVTAPFNPAGVPIAVFGATAPDWLEWVLQAVGKRVVHRTVTHYLASWLLGIGFALVVWDFHGLLFWFSVGGLLHVFCDSLTVSGVPLGWWSSHRFHLFGARLRTGEPAEYFVVGGVLVCMALVGWSMGKWGVGGYDFMPFFYDWGGLYDEGLIDGWEWRQNRFRWL